jgi:hypothetical protein
MKAIHPKFLNKKAEVFGLEMRDVFICMSLISIMKFLDVTDLIVIGVPSGYLAVKFVLNLFFPRAHFTFLLKKKKYLEWSRNIKG